jgi:hypothetical protein
MSEPESYQVAGWNVFPTRTAVHVVPPKDTRPHIISHLCECGPKQESVLRAARVLFVHNAWDGRE